MQGDRQLLRTTFDRVGDQYQRARPEYPGELYRTLIKQADIDHNDRLLEIGCASGKATLPLARLGFRLTCLEIGPALASAANRNLAPYPQVDVVNSAFETWIAPGPERFDLIFAATAWHWIDP